MLELTVNKNDSGQRIDKFLQKTFKKLPLSLMYKAIRQKDIKLNGKRVKENTIIKQGDILNLYIPDDLLDQSKQLDYVFLNVPDELDILYEDENIIALNKPVGLTVHPDETFHLDSELFRLQKYLYKKGEFNPENEHSFSPAFANRLDRNTSGIVLAAKNSQSLKILNEKIKSREIEKYYICETHGHFYNKHKILTAYHYKNADKNRVRISYREKKNYKKIITEYKVIYEKPNSSIVEIHLITGRTHQIRAHMAYIGHPLCGEKKYCDKNLENVSNRYSYQALVAYKIKFNFKKDADILEYLNKKEIKLKKKNYNWFK